MISARDEKTQRVLHAVLNSSTYYQFYCAYTDARHINPSDVYDYPFTIDSMRQSTIDALSELSQQLEDAMKDNTSQWRKSGLLIDSVDSKPCKPIIDEIDRTLANHFGYTEEERDFVINYDYKFRMGTEAAEETGHAGEAEEATATS